MNHLAALSQAPQPWAPNLDPRGERPRRHDAQLALEELRVLTDDLDIAVAPEVAALAEPLVDRFSERPTSGDHLRLPQLTSHDGPAIRAAMRRVLSADTSRPGGSPEAVVREAKMQRVFLALEYAARLIGQRTPDGSSLGQGVAR